MDVATIAGLIVFVALVLRVILDVAELNDFRGRLDAAYGWLFTIAGIAMIGSNASSIFGYLALFLGIGHFVVWYWKRSKKRKVG